VSRGDQIGQVGSTGLSTGPHVHFMVREDGVTVDPKSYLPPINASTTNAN
jgi:murein DD-endopeptidase MepM/ murein hydrolase activator NlpD